jgi:cysteine desulfuration protein SufE
MIDDAMSTMQDNAEAQELIDAFSFLGDWEQRYQFIIDLGRKLAPMEPALKTDHTRVYGCQATVYLFARVNEDSDPRTIQLIAEADAAIVNGLIAILTRVYNGRTPREILAFDVESLLEKLDLEKQLSPTRRNGLHEMVKRIRALAGRYLEEAK